MADMKDKMKDFMKKVNNPFSSSSSGKFKGQGRVLGSSSSGSTNPIPSRPSHPVNSRPNPNPSPAPSANSKPSSQKIPQPERPVIESAEEKKVYTSSNSNPNRAPPDGFDPYGSLITTGKRNKLGLSLNVFECPVCNQAFRSEVEVSGHIEFCVNDSTASVANGAISGSENEVEDEPDCTSEVEVRVGAYVSGKPPVGSVDVVIRLLRNIIKEPENVKFRRIRMSNPKIREAVGEVTGCVELIECVGFKLVEEEGEMWAFMDVPSEENTILIKRAISLIEPREVEDTPPASNKVVEDDKPQATNQGSDSEKKPVDRQIRVFFSVSESVAAKIELPDSFFKLSVDEVKREADLRRKKIADSQLLVPKSYKEKQAKAARSRYTKSIIRIQFPDGVLLQGVFSPREPTSALYEFVSSALKQQGLEFELLHPIPVLRRTIPCFPATGEKASTLDEMDLVPSALVKFRPIETDSMVFTGLKNELLEISEPLESRT
ncbi:hypothetical protein V2J09_015104 [Rumex salicifolius]